ncbi:ATP-binding protein [Oerskovia rustica]|uniref:ATP-binding protein n=1 Tax=Oerskovia rustica TaxID=2762237 RepID=A0ABR8RTV6_9CELL|nr:ATP-binding protein [Oerskovia rustica]MBD7951225.1 ATP-binding protein [Oerskovia rustica]
MADEQRRPDRRLTSVQRRRLQARLPPEGRKRRNDERRNPRKRLKRAQEARARESRVTTSHEAAERVREAVERHRLAQEKKQAQARLQGEREHLAQKRFLSSAYRNAPRWRLKTLLPEVIAYSHEGQWLESAPLDVSLQPLTPEAADSMRAWSQEVAVPRADLLVSLFLRTREQQRRDYEERERERLDRWTAREESLTKQRPFRPRRFTPARVERLVAGALDGAVRESQHDTFKRSRGRLVLQRTTWDLTAACTLLSSVASVLEKQAHAYKRADLGEELAEYRWGVENHLASVHAGEVALVPPKSDEEDWDDWGLDCESLTRLMSDDSCEERKRYLEEAARRYKGRMQSYQEAVDRLDETRPDPQEMARPRRNLLREGATTAERRAQRAQRLYERRGRAGEVLEVEDAAEEVERFHAMLSARQHPHMIWDHHPARQVSRVDLHWLNSKMRRLSVEAKDDLLESFIKDARFGLSELILNALDADSDHVDVVVEEGAGGGIDAISVVDDGIGMTLEEAEDGFSGIGGSWKRRAEATRGQRLLHGHKGRGRYAAYGLGNRAVWESVATQEDGTRKRVRIEGTRGDLTGFGFEVDPEDVSGDTGTKVRMTLPTAEAQTWLLRETVVDLLTAQFALYLTRYPKVEITFWNKKIDPKRLITETNEYDLGEFQGEPVTLTVLEWNRTVDRHIFFCDEEGMTIAEVPSRIHAKDHQFTAYLKWRNFRELKHDWMLAEMGGGDAAPVLEAAKDKLKTHFKERDDALKQKIIKDWRDENVYPFTGEPQSEAEAVKKETFDIIAVAASRIINESKPKGKKLALTLIREATENDPSSLKRVLRDVIGLSKDELAEFDSLLNRTSLSNVLRASRVIGDRLDFLTLLDTIIYDKGPKKATLERDHLHKMLEQEPWVFGEEWGVSTSDLRLSRVLREHLELLGEDVSVAEDPNDPVLLIDGRDGRPDLVLWRAAKVQQNRFEHLMVELKRPSVKLTHKELTQIELYANAVMEDRRFNKDSTRWEFFLIGDEIDSFVEGRRTQQNMPKGAIQHTKECTIWVKLWSEILQDANHRHKFVEENLNWQASNDRSVERMREKYSAMLPDVPLSDAERDATTTPDATETDGEAASAGASTAIPAVLTSAGDQDKDGDAEATA